MKIIILGAGQVGTSVAESLASEANDITVVDTNPARLQPCRTGSTCAPWWATPGHPDLRTGGRRGCRPAARGDPERRDQPLRLQARRDAVQHPDQDRAHPRRDYSTSRAANVKNFAIDRAICPEQILTDYIVKLIEFPEALQVLEFAEGRVSLVAVRAFHGGPLVGHPISDMRRHMPKIDARIAAIFRKDQPIIPEGDTVIEAGDEVFFLAATENIRDVMRELRRMDKPCKRIMIAGGGNIGLRLARALEARYQVKLIEQNKAAPSILPRISSTRWCSGRRHRRGAAREENIGDMDLFLALTNDDENNIMSSLLAKRMGASGSLR